MKRVSIKNNLEVLLRNAKESDAQEIIEFYNIVGGETTYLSFVAGEYKVSVEQEKNTINYANESNNNTMIVGTIDDKIIALGTITSNQKKKGKHVGILGIVIKEEYCNLGLGKIMMDELINWCKSNGVTSKISLVVRKDNIRGMELYKKCGFEVEGILRKEVCIDGYFFDLVAMGLII